MVFPGGADLFVKAVGASLNPDAPDMYRREAVVSAALPASSFVPQLVDVYDDGDWIALAFRGIDGHNPHTPWRQSDLDVVMTVLN
jgi:hypothetical protein